MITVNNLDFTTPEQSNLFLRALWASLRKRFKKLGWQYTPRKFGDKQKVRFGWMTLGASSPTGVEVSIRYGKVGCIKSIEFELRDGIAVVYPDIKKTLRACTQQARELMQHPVESLLKTQIESTHQIPLSYYEGKNWQCRPLLNNNIEIGILVRGFDKEDISHEYENRLQPLLDMLSALTNLSFQKTRNQEIDYSLSEENKNIFLTDTEFLDGCPVESGYLRITRENIRFCDDLIAGIIGDDQLIQAAHMFHHGLKAYHTRLPSKDYIALTLFISALESVEHTFGNSQRCPQCNQPKRQLKQAVKDLGVKHLGDAVGKNFQDCYDLRSAFLHQGGILPSQPLVQCLIPQLDPNGIQGCKVPYPIFGKVNNLMEYTSFIIRQAISFNDHAAYYERV